MHGKGKMSSPSCSVAIREIVTRSKKSQRVLMLRSFGQGQVGNGKFHQTAAKQFVLNTRRIEMKRGPYRITKARNVRGRNWQMRASLMLDGRPVWKNAPVVTTVNRLFEGNHATNFYYKVW